MVLAFVANGFSSWTDTPELLAWLLICMCIWEETVIHSDLTTNDSPVPFLNEMIEAGVTTGGSFLFASMVRLNI